jgi:hypothetical protein
MTALVQQWSQGDESQRAFAARHGISSATLRYWHRQLRVGKAKAGPRGFTPVHVVVDADGTGGVLEIVFPDGVRLVIREGTSAAFVTQVLTALRAC